MRTHTKTCLAAAGLAALALVTVACSGADEKPAATGDAIGAAIVPSADLVARIDMKAIRATPTCKAIADDVTGSEEAPAGAPDEAKERFEKLQKITGLTADDLLLVLLSADMDAVDLGGDDAGSNLEKAKGVLAITLAKPLPAAKLTEAMKAAVEGEEETQLEEIQVAGQAALYLTSTKPNEPTVYLASGPGDHIVFVSPTSEGLEGALQRAAGGEQVELPAALESVKGTLPAGAQFKLAFLAPDKLRQGIKDQLAEAQKDPGAAMYAGFVKPFEELKSLAIGVECGAELEIAIGGDLGTEEGATQIATLLQTMVLPMAKGGMAKALGKEPAEIDDRFEVSATGPMLKIGVRLTQEDLDGLREKKAADKAEAAAGT
jgi:hypothetical protein